MRIEAISKLYDYQVSGEYVKTIPRDSLPTPHDLIEYYGVDVGHRHFKSVSKPTKFDRIVIRTDRGSYAIVPNNPKAFKIRYTE